jgi:hypothetical protein
MGRFEGAYTGSENGEQPTLEGGISGGGKLEWALDGTTMGDPEGSVTGSRNGQHAPSAGGISSGTSGDVTLGWDLHGTTMGVGLKELPHDRGGGMLPRLEAYRVAPQTMAHWEGARIAPLWEIRRGLTYHWLFGAPTSPRGMNWDIEGQNSRAQLDTHLKLYFVK